MEGSPNLHTLEDVPCNHHRLLKQAAVIIAVLSKLSELAARGQPKAQLYVNPTIIINDRCAVEMLLLNFCLHEGLFMHCRTALLRFELALPELASEPIRRRQLSAEPATALLSGHTAAFRAKYKTYLFTILH